MSNEKASPASEASTSESSPGNPRKKIRRIRLEKRSREQSSIAFPYMDLGTAISVAEALLKSGGVALTRDQLAGAMNAAPSGGTFLMKIATARLFGVLASVQGKYELTNLGFSIIDSDEKRQRQARADAFLTVPLYRKVYEEFKGKQLPPRPQGLEQTFVRFGVAPKQKSNARLAFEKSAQQAGFCGPSVDRLIEPIIGGSIVTGKAEFAASSDTKVDAIVVPASIGAAASGYHPFIQGLLKALPEADTNWAVEGRAKWLQAAANCFDLMYKGSGEIKIVATGDNETSK